MRLGELQSGEDFAGVNEGYFSLGIGSMRSRLPMWLRYAAQ